MEDITTSIESTINRATDVRNSPSNSSLVADFCNLINRDPQCAHIAVRAVANKIQSPHEWEALQALSVLDSCMRHCGSFFHAEVGKFRFLNEMIKLVSPKYLGNRTSAAVRSKVLQLMHTWSINYPRETKIREAYEMLKKQGVIQEDPSLSSSQPDVSGASSLPPRSKNTIFEDDEKSRLLQKLLQSKNPDDLQAANRLIKTMVKEDERRVEVNSRRITELESVHNNARLLSEMLDSYRPDHSSREELELIKELHQSCERLRPNVFRLASETQDNEAMLNEVLSASDELGQVFDKYTAIIILGKSSTTPQKSSAAASLLDLSTPSEEKIPPVPVNILENKLTDLDFNITHITPADDKTSMEALGISPVVQKSNYDVLGDIFSSITPSNIPSLPTQPILQPVNIQTASAHVAPADMIEVPEKSSKMKALDDLDSMGESMLKQSLPNTCTIGSQFSKPAVKVPMNLMGKAKIFETHDSSALYVNADCPTAVIGKSGTSLDLDFLIGGAVKAATASANSDLLNGDDSMVDLNEEGSLPYPVEVLDNESEIRNKNTNLPELPEIQPRKESPLPETKNIAETNENSKNIDKNSSNIDKLPTKAVEVKPLTDIFVSLDSIKPGPLPPLTVLEERNGITVILHFAKDAPRSDVSVIVVTTISNNSSKLTGYLFQAVVPKPCKLRLQPPSSTELPAHSPFLPPSAITQVMLIANPNKDRISLKFILSYTMDDEMLTEMGEVDELPAI